ncbi:hypothetical protein FQN57_006840 [Myotisia sp. PD_48]|nr:hypothetical protein FQN57_006840 [Myotisia sp. PD_48]
MDAFPPSYQSATARDAWTIVAPYIRSADICAASLVSRKWHSIFAPFLWGAPASHFGTENDAVYVALTRFKRTLKIAGPCIRQLTHTLHIPPALSEIYGGPRSTWLHEILESLPNLQSLLVSRLPFFDHSSLLALNSSDTSGSPDAEEHIQAYNLRLLIADHEPNTTSAGLLEALIHFPSLVYLDLSYTTAARGPDVLHTLSYLQDLRILKLQGIGLKDSDMEILAKAIQTRVRWLDVRKNFLTDKALRNLFQHCFLPPDIHRNEEQLGRDNMNMEWSRLVGPLSDVIGSDFLKSEHLDKQLLSLYTTPLTGRSALEDISSAGITHLYIADNNLSVEGLRSLLHTKKLHVLDGGTADIVDIILKREKDRAITNGVDSPLMATFDLPGAEKLIPVLSDTTAQPLTFLRIHHAVVTKDAPRKEISVNCLLPELADSEQSAQGPVELESSAVQISELPTEANNVFELADTSVSVASNDEASTQASPPQENVSEEFVPVLNATGTGISESRPLSKETSSSEIDITAVPLLSNVPVLIRSSPTLSVFEKKQEMIQYLLNKRPKSCNMPIRSGDMADCAYLHPSKIPHLRTLILTDVPSTAPASSSIISYLIRFISTCGDEALLATLQAETNYSLPPGRHRKNAELRHAKKLFALETLVLEITPVPKPLGRSGLSPWVPTGYSQSSTGDLDSENLWVAAKDDFSFFSDDEECGIRDSDRGHFPKSLLNEKIVLSPEADDRSPIAQSTSPIRSNARPSYHSHQPMNQQQHLSSPTGPDEPMVDVFTALANFRQAKRAEYNELLRKSRTRKNGLAIDPDIQFSPVPPFVEGHWTGDVKIVRNSVSK